MYVYHQIRAHVQQERHELSWELGCHRPYLDMCVCTNPHTPLPTMYCASRSKRRCFFGGEGGEGWDLVEDAMRCAALRCLRPNGAAIDPPHALQPAQPADKSQHDSTLVLVCPELGPSISLSRIRDRGGGDATKTLCLAA